MGGVNGRISGSRAENGHENIRNQKIHFEEIHFEEVKIKEVRFKEIGVEKVKIKEVRFKKIDGKEVNIEEIGVEKISLFAGKKEKIIQDLRIAQIIPPLGRGRRRSIEPTPSPSQEGNG